MTYLPEVRMDALAVEVPTRDLPVQTNRQISKSISFRLIWLLIYLLVLLLPIYWMFNMSLRDNNDIMSRLAFFPVRP